MAAKRDQFKLTASQIAFDIPMKFDALHAHFSDPFILYLFWFGQNWKLQEPLDEMSKAWNVPAHFLCTLEGSHNYGGALSAQKKFI